MQRITVSMDQQLAQAFDALIEKRGYRNRSEAVRDLLRQHLEAQHESTPAEDQHSQCVANLSYVYNHHARDLAERLMALQHDHHDLTVATMHAHLDHAHCLESVILRGERAAVRAFADALSSERGVSHGQLNVVTVDAATHAHSHGGQPSAHLHLKPRQ